MFKVIIPLVSDFTMQATMQAEDQANKQITKILEFCEKPRSRAEIQEYMGLRNGDNFRINIINPLIKGELLKLTVPDKPTSPKQKYYSGNDTEIEN